MLVCEKKIRLTKKEAESFKTWTDWAGPAPKSAETYNGAVREAAEEAEDGTPEGRLLAAIIESLKAPEV